MNKMSFEVYSVGLCYASVCTSLPIDEATRRLNIDQPTGITSKWKLSADKKFRTGEPNPCSCKDHAGNLHYLFSC